MTIWSLVLKMNHPIGAEKGKKGRKKGKEEEARRKKGKRRGNEVMEFQERFGLPW